MVGTSVVVKRARRQREACLLEDSGGAIEIENRQHHVIDRTPLAVSNGHDKFSSRMRNTCWSQRACKITIP
jgi:hypothetical protein